MAKLRTLDKIFVGLQNRIDTFFGKIGFVLDNADNSDLKKWHDKSQGIKEFDNVPTEGFSAFKISKGQRHDFGSRKDRIRITDPRGFDVEIKLENFLRLVMECGVKAGGEIDAKLIYFWSGTTNQIVLFAEGSEEYQRHLQGFKTLTKSKTSTKSKNTLEINKPYRLDSNYYDSLLTERRTALVAENSKISVKHGYLRLCQINNGVILDGVLNELPKTVKKIKYTNNARLENLNHDSMDLPSCKIVSTTDKIVDEKMKVIFTNAESGFVVVDLDNGRWLLIGTTINDGLNTVIGKCKIIYKNDGSYHIAPYNSMNQILPSFMPFISAKRDEIKQCLEHFESRPKMKFHFQYGPLKLAL